MTGFDQVDPPRRAAIPAPRHSDPVEAGAALVVVEAMKMENELCAARSGTVRKIHVTPGQNVESGARLVEIE